jgi:hypothetical protein
MPLVVGQLPAGHRCDIGVRHCAAGFRHIPSNPLGTKGFARGRPGQERPCPVWRRGDNTRGCVPCTREPQPLWVALDPCGGVLVAFATGFCAA